MCLHMTKHDMPWYCRGYWLLQSMPRKQQLNLDFKLQPPANQAGPAAHPPHAGQNTAIETPGWTSVKHPNSPHSPAPSPSLKEPLSHSQILQKLTKLDDLNHLSTSNYTYSKARMSRNETHGENQQAASNRGIFTESRCNKENESRLKQSTSTRDGGGCHRLASTRNRTLADNSLAHSGISSGVSGGGGVRPTRTGTIIKNVKKEVPSVEPKVQKRFKHITVHDHLYVDSKRQQTKRLLEQMLDEDIKKQTILTFTPFINKKSEELAFNKFNRTQAKLSLEVQLEQELRDLQGPKTGHHNPPARNTVSQQQREEHLYQALNTFFYILSQESEIMTRQTMKGSIEEVPLICIKIIDKIIAKLYQGRSFSWLQFLGAVNDKKMVKNREALISVVDKWLLRRSTTGKEESYCYQTKEETSPNLYL